MAGAASGSMARPGLFARRTPPGKPVALEARQYGHPTSRGFLGDNEITRRNRISFRDRFQIYVQNPFYRNGVLLSTNDTVREWVKVVDPDGEPLEAENREWEMWSREISLKRKTRDALTQAHVFDNGIAELVFDDDGPPNAEAPAGAELVDVNILPRKTTNLTLRQAEDGSYRFGAKHRPFGAQQIEFHPDRIHAFEVQPNPEDVGGLSTAEAAYHDALSYIQAAQSHGEIVRHHGPGFKFARVTDNDDETIKTLKNVFAGKGADGKGNGQEMLRGIATGDNVEMENFDASSLDVAPFVEAMRMGIASALGLPVAYLEGVQAGAVSGAQTNRAFIQDQVQANREFNVDPFIVRVMDLKFPDMDVDHEWNPFPSLPMEEAAMFRDRSGGVEALVRAGVPLSLALRESGIEVTQDDLEEATSANPNPFFQM